MFHSHPHSRSRTPRFDRVPVRRMALTTRDLDILRAVHRHRLLRSTHVATITGGSRQTTLRRLQLLFHHGYLDRPPMQLDWYARGSEPMVYALGNRGAQVLEVAGRNRGDGRWDAKNRGLSRVFLHHTLAVAEVMVAFEAACRNQDQVCLITPAEILTKAPPETQKLRRPFRWRVEVGLGQGSELLGIEPDRVFGLCFEDDPRRSEFFFLEADRGTMPVFRKGSQQTSFFRKLRVYRETWLQRVQISHLGIPNFRVLTVTTTRERVMNLVAASQSLGGGAGLYLFTTRADLHGRNILSHEWTNGRGQPARIRATKVKQL